MMSQRRHRDGDTATQILDVAEYLAQSRGFNGFSYADVAAELQLTKAALHYHFAGKAELGEALSGRYSDRFAAALKLAELPRNSSPSRIHNRCEITGRPKAYYRKLKMSRIALRDLGSKGLIPGLLKSSW